MLACQACVATPGLACRAARDCASLCLLTCQYREFRRLSSHDQGAEGRGLQRTSENCAVAGLLRLAALEFGAISEFIRPGHFGSGETAERIGDDPVLLDLQRCVAQSSKSSAQLG